MSAENAVDGVLYSLAVLSCSRAALLPLKYGGHRAPASVFQLSRADCHHDTERILHTVKYGELCAV